MIIPIKCLPSSILRQLDPRLNLIQDEYEIVEDEYYDDEDQL